MKRHLLRLRSGRRVYYLLAVTLLVLIAAGCSTSLAPQPTARTTTGPDYVLTVALEAGDTLAAVEQRYGGRAIVWEPGAYAILGLRSGLGTQAVLSTAAEDGVAVEANHSVFQGGGQPAEMNGRSTLWAGGRSSLWAGGRSSLWAGGRSSLWAGGEYTWMPENTALWRQIHLEEGHAIATHLGYGVTVAVIDTGIDLEHPALQDALAPASMWWDFYDDDPLPQEEGELGVGGFGHGTNVAGIVRQIAPRATILPLRVLGPDGQGDVADLVEAIHYAVEQGAQIINLSLGSDEEVKAVEEVVKAAAKEGVFIVASTGNTGDEHVTFPASKGKADKLRVSVTSVDADDHKSSFATFDKDIGLAAPGENVYGPAPDTRLAAWSGTSMAAPMASGALALALGEALRVPTKKLGKELVKNSDDLYHDHRNGPFKDKIGEGRLNLETFLLDVVER